MDRGVLPNGLMTVMDAWWHGWSILELTYNDAGGTLGSELRYGDRKPKLEVVGTGSPWGFNADAAMFRLVSEARRVRLARPFDPLLAVHSSLVAPLPYHLRPSTKRC
jgi:hypothetical protein